MSERVRRQSIIERTKCKWHGKMLEGIEAVKGRDNAEAVKVAVGSDYPGYPILETRG